MYKIYTLIVTVVVLALAGTFIYFLIFAGTGEEELQMNGQDEISQIGQWRTYASSEFDFTFLYPPEATARVESGQAKVTYLGTNNTPNSEITDGFTFYVRTQEHAADATLEAIAQEWFAEEQQFGIVADPSATSIDGASAYTFAVQSALGPTITHVVVEAGPAAAYHISYMVADPENRGYASIIEQMIGSLQYIPAGEGSGAATTTQVSIALLDTEFEGEPERGCDMVVLQEQEVESTTAPLTAALQALFALEDTNVGEYYNFIATTNDTLSFDRAVVEDDGTARIYLEGSVSGYAGACDNPRAAIQIEETALQFETVDNVVLYLNSEETDLMPDASGMN